MLRLLGAFCLFVGTLTGAVVGFLHLTASQPTSGHRLVDSQEDEGLLFYRRLGEYAASLTGNGSKGLGRVGGKDSFTLEVLVTDDREKAVAEVDRLAKDGVKAFFTPLDRKGKIIYRVRLGVYPSQGDAMQHSRELAIVKGIRSKLVRLN